MLINAPTLQPGRMLRRYGSWPGACRGMSQPLIPSSVSRSISRIGAHGLRAGAQRPGHRNLDRDGPDRPHREERRRHLRPPPDWGAALGGRTWMLRLCFPSLAMLRSIVFVLEWAGGSSEAIPHPPRITENKKRCEALRAFEHGGDAMMRRRRSAPISPSSQAGEMPRAAAEPERSPWC
jgi:hypothetical protein